MIVRIDKNDFASGLKNVKRCKGASYNGADKTWTVDDSEAVAILSGGLSLIPVTVPPAAVAEMARRARQITYKSNPVVLIKQHDGQTVRVLTSSNGDGRKGVYIGEELSAYFEATGPDAWPAAVKTIFDAAEWETILAGVPMEHEDADARADQSAQRVHTRASVNSHRGGRDSNGVPDYAATHYVGQASMEHEDSIF